MATKAAPSSAENYRLSVSRGEKVSEVEFVIGSAEGCSTVSVF